MAGASLCVSATELNVAYRVVTRQPLVQDHCELLAVDDCIAGVTEVSVAGAESEGGAVLELLVGAVVAGAALVTTVALVRALAVV